MKIKKSNIRKINRGANINNIDGQRHKIEILKRENLNNKNIIGNLGKTLIAKQSQDQEGLEGAKI